MDHTQAPPLSYTCEDDVHIFTVHISNERAADMLFERLETLHTTGPSHEPLYFLMDLRANGHLPLLYSNRKLAEFNRRIGQARPSYTAYVQPRAAMVAFAEALHRLQRVPAKFKLFYGVVGDDTSLRTAKAWLASVRAPIL